LATGVVVAIVAASLTALFAAPTLKDPPPGPPMTAEQLRAALKDKGSITYADGLYRLAVGKVDGLDLLDLELRKVEGGKVVSKLTSPRARLVSVDLKAGTMRLLFSEMKVVTGDMEMEGWNQEYDFPAPRQGKRP
jgi:hypothetical protein